MAEKDKKSQKGVAGENTGGEARREIKKAKSRGATNESIGKATNRDEDTIRNIASGNIKNPPSNLVDNIKKAKSVKKREDAFGSMTMGEALEKAKKRIP